MVQSETENDEVSEVLTDPFLVQISMLTPWDALLQQVCFNNWIR